jgi:ABC-2 type transport system ATP-binding protein
VFLTTHFMDEAQYLANRVAVISHGEIVAEGPPDTLAGRDTMRARIRFRVAGDGATPPDLGQTRSDDGSFEIRVEDPTGPVHALTGWALDGGIQLEVFEVTRPSLEDVYLDITGGEEGSE